MSSPSFKLKDLKPTIALPENLKKNRIISLFPVDEVMDILALNYSKKLKNTYHSKIYINSYLVSLSNLKLRTFSKAYKENDNHCANTSCEVKPEFFALELPEPGARANRAYLSLYGLDKNGMAVEFTHDHTLARCFGGANSLVNTTMMCKECNNQKSVIESKVHNKTLKILKDYLESETGQDAEPYYLLERIKKFDFDLDDDLPALNRAGVLDVNEVIEIINDEEIDSHYFLGKKVKTKSPRLKALANNNLCCSDESCNIKATHFAVERVANRVFKDDSGWFLTMYGKDKDENEIRFSHHHFINEGGTSLHGLEIKTLCIPCKKKTMLEEQAKMAYVLTNMGGVSEDDLIYQDKLIMKEYVNQMKSEMMVDLGLFDDAKFIEYCNKKGSEQDYEKIQEMKQKRSHFRVIKNLKGIGLSGAVWLVKKHSRRFGKELTVKLNERAYDVLKPSNSTLANKVTPIKRKRAFP